MVNESLVDCAFDVLTKRKAPVKFRELYEEAIKLGGIVVPPEGLARKLAQFYTQLSLDGRFIVLTDNYWDLRTKHLFKEAHIDMEEAYSDEEEAEPDEEEREEGEGGEEEGEGEPAEEDEENIDYSGLKTPAPGDAYY